MPRHNPNTERTIVRNARVGELVSQLDLVRSGARFYHGPVTGRLLCAFDDQVYAMEPTVWWLPDGDDIPIPDWRREL